MWKNDIFLIWNFHCFNLDLIFILYNEKTKKENKT